MKHQEKILEQSRDFLITLYKERPREQTPYHTLEKVWDTVDIAEKIGEKVNLNETEHFEVMMASSFLYTGFWNLDERHTQQALKNLEEFAKATSLEDSMASIVALMKSVEDI